MLQACGSRIEVLRFEYEIDGPTNLVQVHGDGDTCCMSLIRKQAHPKISSYFQLAFPVGLVCFSKE